MSVIARVYVNAYSPLDCRSDTGKVGDTNVERCCSTTILLPVLRNDSFLLLSLRNVLQL